MNGKGDRPRPFDREKWYEGWERAFGKLCKHPGCRNHVSHPCEVCGYQSGMILKDGGLNDNKPKGQKDA